MGEVHGDGLQGDEPEPRDAIVHERGGRVGCPRGELRSERVDRRRDAQDRRDAEVALGGPADEGEREQQRRQQLDRGHRREDRREETHRR